MPKTLAGEEWKKMVLRTMPIPAWLCDDAPQNDVVISTRVRYARNLARYPFPTQASREQLRSIEQLILQALEDLPMQAQRNLTVAERDYYLGCRLISPEFAYHEVGRELFFDEARELSLMVNEEDHLRLQALGAGWCLERTLHAADYLLKQLGKELPFAWDSRWGYLTSSPYNAGLGRRLSAMLHLIGLAHTKKLAAALKALNSESFVTRGLFGESSRGVGAFFQVSTLKEHLPSFVGGCEYLLSQERQARAQIARKTIFEKASAAREHVLRSQKLSLADALRVLAWVRWAAAIELDSFPMSVRQVDAWVAALEVRGTHDDHKASSGRAKELRGYLEK